MTSQSQQKRDDYKYLYKFEKSASSIYIGNQNALSPKSKREITDIDVDASITKATETSSKPATTETAASIFSTDNPVISTDTPAISTEIEASSTETNAVSDANPPNSEESLESPMQIIRKHIHSEKKNHHKEMNANVDNMGDYENVNVVYPHFVIDPLSLIAKLAILSMKPTKTKISMVNHRILIHEPGFFQGVVRYYNNSTKQDLHYLQIPIETACMQYIILPTFKNNRERFVNLFKQATLGLESLAVTYKSDSMVVLCINHYINLIHNAISMNSIIMSKDVDDIRKYYNEVFMNKMKNIWRNDKMEIVLRLAECMDTTSVRSLEIFMEGIDEEVGLPTSRVC